MKPKLEQLAHKRKNRSFLCYEVNLPSFEFKWHYHPEYELTLIVKGRGKRLVGDSYESYEKGDLVLIGPLLPHTWVGEKKKNQNYVAIVIQFSLDFIQPLLSYKEMGAIKKLLAKADSGVKFLYGRDRKSIDLIQKMVSSNEFDLLISLAQVLQNLSTIKTKTLSTANFKPLKGNENEQRINTVFQYVQREFKQKISLSRAASLIYLSESAFCKFFKRVSGKTFSDYVNEIRIAAASQFLIETDRPISQIASDSGFVSLTYFNRVFLKKKGSRPSEVRKI
jgi:YesN/AraC family two-component response regulator